MQSSCVKVASKAVHTRHSFVRNARYLCEAQAAYFLLCLFMRLYSDDCVRSNVMMPHCIWITHIGLGGLS